MSALVSLHVGKTHLNLKILHAASMPYDDDMVNMHVCILALSQVTLQSAVCMLCNGIIIQPRASGSWSCLYTTTLFTPVSGCQSIPLLCLHGIVCHVQSQPVMKTHKSSCKSSSCEGISLACAFMKLYTVFLCSEPVQFSSVSQV